MSEFRRRLLMRKKGRNEELVYEQYDITSGTHDEMYIGENILNVKVVCDFQFSGSIALNSFWYNASAYVIEQTVTNGGSVNFEDNFDAESVRLSDKPYITIEANFHEDGDEYISGTVDVTIRNRDTDAILYSTHNESNHIYFGNKRQIDQILLVVNGDRSVSFLKVYKLS